MKVKHGITRTVFLMGRYAIKTPNLKFRWLWRHRVKGLLANLDEAWRWKTFKDSEEGQMLCPVLWKSWFGFVIVMRRVEPMECQDGIISEPQCVLTTDHKAENYGWLDGRLVCIDYAQ